MVDLAIFGLVIFFIPVAVVLILTIHAMPSVLFPAGIAVVVGLLGARADERASRAIRRIAVAVASAALAILVAAVISFLTADETRRLMRLPSAASIFEVHGDLADLFFTTYARWLLGIAVGSIFAVVAMSYFRSDGSPHEAVVGRGIAVLIGLTLFLLFVPVPIGHTGAALRSVKEAEWRYEQNAAIRVARDYAAALQATAVLSEVSSQDVATLARILDQGARHLTSCLGTSHGRARLPEGISEYAFLEHRRCYPTYAVYSWALEGSGFGKPNFKLDVSYFPLPSGLFQTANEMRALEVRTEDLQQLAKTAAEAAQRPLAQYKFSDSQHEAFWYLTTAIWISGNSGPESRRLGQLSLEASQNPEAFREAAVAQAARNASVIVQNLKLVEATTEKQVDADLHWADESAKAAIKLQLEIAKSQRLRSPFFGQ